MHADNPGPLAFRKSSYSGSGDNCVEVADVPGGAAVRDSKCPDAGHLAIAAGEWSALLWAVARETA
ncbi:MULTISPECIES: DUF397 domain-containing protein [unclassified Nocardiopsis]|uniref:DUF397 domain-containing protein n=1 Tax=Nocardiopsis TaxID=2013 RepID=UPI00387B0784